MPELPELDKWLGNFTTKLGRLEEAVEGGQKGQLDGKPAGARISKGRKMPHVNVIRLCQNFDLPLFVALSKFLSIIVNIQ